MIKDETKNELLWALKHVYAKMKFRDADVEDRAYVLDLITQVKEGKTYGKK